MKLAWWGNHHVEPLGVASALWRQTHPLPVKPQQPGLDAALTDLPIAATGKSADSPAMAPTFAN